MPVPSRDVWKGSTSRRLKRRQLLDQVALHRCETRQGTRLSWVTTSASVAMLKLKRAYDPVSKDDGRRFLVERRWPRGLSKARLHVDAWLKEVTPSTELRQWFSHDPDKWSRFRARYFRELDARPESWRPILSAAGRGTVTLVYSSHDEDHNNAVALQEYLQAKRRRRATSRESVAGRRTRRASR